MGYFERAAEAREVELSFGYRAKVRSITGAEDDQARDYAWGGAGWRRGSTASLVFDQTRFQAAVACAGIIEWDLQDDRGAPIAVTPEVVGKMVASDRDALVLAIRGTVSAEKKEPIATA